MKRIIFTLVCVFLIFGGHHASYAHTQSPAVTVEVDGMKVDFDVEPVIQEGRTLVPFRAIAEALGVEVNWDAANQTVNANHSTTSIRLQIGNDTASVNEIPILLEVSPTILQGRTMIPLRFFSENLLADVTWEETTRTVSIISPLSLMNVMGFYALGDRQTSSWTNLFGSEYPHMGSGYTDIINELGLGWYTLDEKGNLLKNSPTGWRQPDGWQSVLEAAQVYEMRTEMVVHVPDGSKTLLPILKEPSSTELVIQSIIEEAERNFDGINLNIEGLGFKESPEQLAETQQQFNQFVRKLYEQARLLGLSVTLTLHPPNSVYQGYDYQTLGQVADKIVIMAYDYHQYRERLPEPLHKVVEAVTMAIEGVPAEKLVLGISVYQENEQTLLEKIGVAKKYKLSGIALWRLGLITEKQGASLRTAIIKPSR